MGPILKTKILIYLRLRCENIFFGINHSPFRPEDGLENVYNGHPRGLSFYCENFAKECPFLMKIMRRGVTVDK